MKKLLRIVVFVLTLTACNSNKAPLKDTATSQGNDPSKATLNVTATSQGNDSSKATLNVTANMEDYDSSTYTVPAGAEVTVNFTSDSVVPHVFAILKKDEHITPPYQPTDDDKVMWSITAKPGETKSGTFTAPTEPGEYDIVCPIPGHIEFGMKATLVVKEK